MPRVPLGLTVGVTLLGLMGWTAASVMVTALIAGSRARESLAPLLLYPLAMPLLIAAVNATAAVVAPGAVGLGPALTLLVAYDVIFLVVGFLSFAFVWESAQ